MYRTLTINAAATTAMAAAFATAGDNAQVRIRATEDGTLQIRPTDRTNLSNLPKGEILRPVGTKASARTVGLPADQLPEISAGTVMTVEADKYGWFTLRQVEELARGDAGARVSAK